ncbi:alpha/beta hydrolase family protein [Halovulum marinum]|nr:prolyl oligopeptidase family serine peptidase [Halovulum marinum]
MITERTVYSPKPGKLDEVLATRRRASEIRREIGLRPGEISLESDVDGNPARIQWQCAFPDEAAHKADLDARAASPEFEAIRKTMTGLIDNFERQVLRALPMRNSRLSPQLMAGRSIVPEEVRFPSHGRELAGFLFRPPGQGPFPLMVANHGSSIAQGTQDLCRPSVAALLMSWGVASFLPHRRGYGNSPGTPWREDVSAEYGTDAYDDQLAARLDAESDDVVAARAWVAEQPGIDPDHIGVMGSSFGGTNTLFAAAKEPKFRCAVEFAGAAMNWDRTPNLRKVMHEAASRLTQPTFFIQAANDYSTRPTTELAEGLAGGSVPIRSRVYPSHGLSRDEGHFLYRDGTLVWGPDVRDFLEEYL